MSTDSITDRLRAALDQAQTLADGASSSPGAGEWRVAPSGNLVEGPYVLIDAATSPGIGSWHLAHFAAWSPARVLRLIASHRAAIAAHESADRAVAEHVRDCGPDLCDHHDYTAAVATSETLRDVINRVAEFWLGRSTE